MNLIKRSAIRSQMRIHPEAYLPDHYTLLCVFEWVILSPLIEPGHVPELMIRISENEPRSYKGEDGTTKYGHTGSAFDLVTLRGFEETNGLLPKNDIIVKLIGK